MAKRLRDVKDKVYKILQKSENARNNDGSLNAHFLAEHCKQFIHKDLDGNDVVALKDFKHLPSFESLRRSRQIIQNDDGEFLPTMQSVRKARRIKEEQWRNWEVREAQNHHIGDVKKEKSGMQTIETQSKSEPKEWHKTHRTPEGKYICNCKGSQYGHECIHIKSLKEKNGDIETARLPYKEDN